MKMIELVAPCHFGMEAVLKREILDLGYEISQVEDGRVTFLGDLEAVAYANVFLRTTERILIKVGKNPRGNLRRTFRGNQGPALGGFYSRGRKILGGKGQLHQE